MLMQGWSLWLSVAVLLMSWCLPAAAEPQQLESRHCLGCHGIDGFSIAGRSLHVDRAEFVRGVHKAVSCVACHRDIERIPHQTLDSIKVDCISCHQNRWMQAQQEGTTRQDALLEKVVEQIGLYKNSIHAQASKQDPSRPNAYCSDCHQAHYATLIFSDPGNPGRLKIPDICGRCHTKQREDYAHSVHGEALLQQKNTYAAVCVDCHNTHAIQKTSSNLVKQSVTRNCGNCHVASQKSYRETYHGQVNSLGENRTAKCFNCHGSHRIKRVSDPVSTVHLLQRLQTCGLCHQQVGAGFASFAPHANANDYEHFPLLYLVKKTALIILLACVLFFTLHNILWLWAAHRAHVKHKNKPHIDLQHLDLQLGAGEKYIYRFSALWRAMHLLLALAVLLLILTGMALLYASSSWAPGVIQLLGGATLASQMHRGCGLLLIIMLLLYLGYLAGYLWRKRHGQRQWREHSMLFGQQDWQQLRAMWCWFFDQGAKPDFDRWSYWEKFDYWALLCSLMVLSITGGMMWLPEFTAQFLPGWVFNLNALIHGELAFLATLLLLAIHVFNSYICPNKLPSGAGNFAGCMPLHEYQKQHALSYQHLLETGKLQRYLVDPPSNMMRCFTRMAGWILLLLVLFELIWIVKEFFGINL